MNYIYVGRAPFTLAFVVAKLVKILEAKKPNLDFVQWTNDSNESGLFSLVCGLRPPILKFLLFRICVCKSKKDVNVDSLMEDVYRLRSTISLVEDKKVVRLFKDLDDYCFTVGVEPRQSEQYPQEPHHIDPITNDEHPSISYGSYDRSDMRIRVYNFGDTLSNDMIDKEFPLLFLLGKKLKHSAKEYAEMKKEIEPVLTAFTTMAKP